MLILPRFIGYIRKYAREITVSIFGLLLAFIVTDQIGYLLRSPCGNEVVLEVLSPNRKSKVVVFERGCGATTRNSQQISLLSANTPLSNESGNLLTGNERSAESITVKWKSNTLLEINGAYWREDSMPKTAWNGVVIRYK